MTPMTPLHKAASELASVSPLSLADAEFLLRQFSDPEKALRAANSISNKSNLDIVTCFTAMCGLLKKNPDQLINSDEWRWSEIPDIGLCSRPQRICRICHKPESEHSAWMDGAGWTHDADYR